MQCDGKWKLSSHGTSDCLIEVVTKVGLTVYIYMYDIISGDRTIQCGRRNDVLKLWLMWKGRGDNGMEARVDKAFENAG